MRSVASVAFVTALLIAGGAGATGHKGVNVLAQAGDRPAFGRLGSSFGINYRLRCNVNTWAWDVNGVWGYYRAPRVCPQ